MGGAIIELLVSAYLFNLKTIKKILYLFIFLIINKLGQRSKMDEERLRSYIDLLEVNVGALGVPLAEGLQDDYVEEVLYIYETIVRTIENLKEEL